MMLVITILLVFLMLIVCWFDLTRYIIPNWLVGCLVALYPLAVLLSPVQVEWKLGLISMALVFAIGYFIFFMKWMGGGDIKLFTACALWTGLRDLPNFTFVVAMVGFVFCLLLLVLRKIEPRLPKKENASPTPTVLQNGAPVPYGVAIAIGFVLMLWTARIPAIHFG